MSSTQQPHGTGRRGAGCPPALEVDLVHTTTLAPSIEWPQGPSSRAPAPEADTPDVVDLALGRAVRLLEASMAHLGTVLAVSDSDHALRIGQAIAEIARVRDQLVPPTT